ncbi:MAG: PilZ domain-containing protein [Rhodoblastus sp.]|nr:MAG: PilZ domain-containing protein [Rhodoblastus sp.]
MSRLISDPPAPAQAAFSVAFAGGERRGGARRRVRLRVGRALDGEGRFLCEATIVDLSAQGARLRLADPARLPATLWLFDECERRAAKAQVVRRTAHEAGLLVSEWRSLDELPAATRRRIAAPYYGAD